LELVALLHCIVRVLPTPYYGRMFIDLDCHTIGENSTIFCATLKVKVSETHVASYELA